MNYCRRSITFYSILLFILISLFIPSMYNYAYGSFIGRIIIVFLIIYFSIENIYLGLVFLVIIITTSYPLYEGFDNNNNQTYSIANSSIVTSSPDISDKTNNQEVLNYFTNYYCSEDNNGNLIPDADKMSRWNDMSNPDKNSIDQQIVAGFHKDIASKVCISNDPMYQQNKTSLTDDITAKYKVTSVGGLFNFIGNLFKSTVNTVSGSNSFSDTEQSELNNIDPCSYKSSNYVISTPTCLNENLSSQICNYAGSTPDSLLSSSKVLANSYNLDPTIQQDGQWYLNMSRQLCQ